MRLGNTSWDSDTITANQWSVLMEGNTKINGDLTITGEIKGGEKDMMGLYEVYVVNTKKEGGVPYLIFAKNEDTAKLKCARKALHAGVGELDEEENDLEYFVRCIGQWKSKKPKEVKIVKEE